MYYNQQKPFALAPAVLGLLLFVLPLSSCMKDNSQQGGGKVAEVSFSIAGVRDGGLGGRETKATTFTEDLEVLLSQTRPAATPTLSICSTTVPSRKYQAQVGETIPLPLDTYSVTGTCTGIVVEACLAGGMSKTPSYQINQTITVTEESSEFPLTAQFTCFAVVLDTRECTGYRHSYVNASMVDITTWVQNGDTKLVYVTPTAEITSDKPYKIQAIPADPAEYESQTYKLTSSGGAGTLRLSNGKWYCFSPKGVDTASGDIGVDFPEWEQGITE